MFALFAKILSTCLILLCIVYLLYGIIEKHNDFTNIPSVDIILFSFGIILLGYLEGLQVAILETEHKQSDDFKESYKRGYVNHKMVTYKKNVQRFLIGRQFFVVFVVFMNAKISTFEDYELEFMPDWFNVFLRETNMPAVLITLIIGQLFPQLVASTHSMYLMNFPLAYYVIKLCLYFEKLRITDMSWGLHDLFSMRHKDEKHNINTHPTPGELRELLESKGEVIESFLLPATDKDHVPPHIAAFHLKYPHYKNNYIV